MNTVGVGVVNFETTMKMSFPLTVVETHTIQQAKANNVEQQQQVFKHSSIGPVTSTSNSGVRVKSISSMTAATATSLLEDTEYLTDHDDGEEEEEEMDNKHMPNDENSAKITAFNEPVSRRTTTIGNERYPAVVSFPEEDNELFSEEEKVAAPLGVPVPTSLAFSEDEIVAAGADTTTPDLSSFSKDDTRLDDERRTTTRRPSILKPTDTEIPIKNRGWKNLPKLDPNRTSTSLSSQSVTRTAAAVSRTTMSRRVVSFTTVEIRCYDQCVGDNPAVSIGTPISLDWTYEPMDRLHVDDYEGARGVRRQPRQMMMNFYCRRHVLTFCFNVTDSELDQAERAATLVRNQRSRTRALLFAAPLEDAITSAARKTKRALQKKKKTAPSTTDSRQTRTATCA